MLNKIRPGDCLLYAPTGVFGWLITIKTWHAVGHTETYVGQGYSVASRDGIGVNLYPLRESDLIAILRPKPEYKFNLNKAFGWFWAKAKGQKYDWRGLLRFTWGSDYSAGNDNNKMFCSEFVLRFYRAGGLDLMPGEDADAVAPFQFEYNPLLEVIWRKGK